MTVARENRPHDCLDHLVYRECESVETHGLDTGPYEIFWDRWFECAICGDQFSDQELAELTEGA
jgi:hypothetical protein